MMRFEIVRMLRTIAVLNALVLLLGLGMAAAGAWLAVGARRREQALEERMAAGARIAAAQAREFTERRAALEPLASGPLGKLDQQIRLMQLMSEEQLALLRQLGGVRGDVAASAAEPAARAGRKPKRDRGEPSPGAR